MDKSIRILYFLLWFEISLPINLSAIVIDIEIKGDRPNKLDFTELASKCGYNAEKHKVVTEDGYVLTAHRIPGEGEAIFLQHGLIDSSDGFILRGNKSIVAALAEKGYDIWLGNFRGNRYSREHLRLTPDDKEFWDFSLDEHGYYDIPATIDYILKTTNKTKLSAIGHSEGTAVFFVLGSRRPEYNDKVKVMIALAPVAYLTNVESPVNLVVDISSLINDALLLLGKEELLNDQSALDHLLTMICNGVPFIYELCSGALFSFFGSDLEEVNKEYIKLMSIYYPTGTSRRNLHHLSQISMSGRFQRYDYGVEMNKKMYGTDNVPYYNLCNVTMQVELIVGKNDKLATAKDVCKLNDKLPNSKLHVVSREKMNHIDFLHGEHMDEYLFPLIFNGLEKCKE